MKLSIKQSNILKIPSDAGPNRTGLFAPHPDNSTSVQGNSHCFDLRSILGEGLFARASILTLLAKLGRGQERGQGVYKSNFFGIIWYGLTPKRSSLDPSFPYGGVSS